MLGLDEDVTYVHDMTATRMASLIAADVHSIIFPCMSTVTY